MLEKILENKEFHIVITLLGAVVVGLTAYEKYWTVKKTKLEINKLQNG